jgi:hypothetical protein
LLPRCRKCAEQRPRSASGHHWLMSGVRRRTVGPGVRGCCTPAC